MNFELKASFKEIEKQVWQLIDTLRHFESYSKEINDAEMPIDVSTSELAIAKHQNLHSLIYSVSIDFFDSDLQELKKRLLFSATNHNNGFHKNGFIGQLKTNPDFASVFPHINQLITSLTSLKNDLTYQWEMKKIELDQCSQLRLFEQDAENLSRWIHTQFTQLSNRMVFIGESELETSRLLNDHLELSDSVDVYLKFKVFCFNEI
jgi:hypothetical protein